MQIFQYAILKKVQIFQLKNHTYRTLFHHITSIIVPTSIIIGSIIIGQMYDNRTDKLVAGKPPLIHGTLIQIPEDIE